MAYKTPLQTLKDEQDFYKGLENSFILAPEVLQQASSEFEGYDINLIQKQIMESPSDVQLDRLMRGKLYEDFIFIFLYQALAQALQYNHKKDLTIIDMDDIPNMYFLDDVDVLYDELKTIPQVGREKLLNHYSNVNPNSFALYKKAIMELDKDSLVRIIESQDIDIVWMQKLLGYIHYNKSINDGVFNGEISWDDSSILLRKILNELPNDDKEPDPYYVEWRANQKKLCDADQNSELGEELPDDILSVMASLYLKSYWFGCSEYDVKSRQIIDNYINKPCFSEFVSKCRAEFEEEERLREEESARGEIVDVYTEPVDEEVQKQASQDNHINKKEKYNDNASDVAANTKRIHYSVKGLSTKGAASGGNNFQWSDSLKKWYEEHTGKFEDFVRYVAKDKGYIPNEQKQVNAFIRTITGRDVPNCDEKVRLLNNGRDDATRAMLYLKKCKIICSGDYCDIFTYFDVDRPERYREKPEDNSWMSGYARDADKDFKITVIETFNDFSGLKVPKEDQNLNIATQKE